MTHRYQKIISLDRSPRLGRLQDELRCRQAAAQSRSGIPVHACALGRPWPGIQHSTGYRADPSIAFRFDGKVTVFRESIRTRWRSIS